jgi:hypothetical protein
MLTDLDHKIFKPILFDDLTAVVDENEIISAAAHFDEWDFSHKGN